MCFVCLIVSLLVCAFVRSFIRSFSRLIYLYENDLHVWRCFPITNMARVLLWGVFPMFWRKNNEACLFGARRCFSKSIGSESVSHRTLHKVKKCYMPKMTPTCSPQALQMTPKWPPKRPPNGAKIVQKHIRNLGVVSPFKPGHIPAARFTFDYNIVDVAEIWA